MTNAAEQAYSSVCDILEGRILALIPEHPEILDIESPFKLFKVDGFKCDDLQPSFAQASGALAWAKREYRKEAGETK